MFTPIIVPVTSHSKTPVCPECGKEEHRIDTCKHCGYKYPESQGSVRGCLLKFFSVILLVFLFIFNAITFLHWIAGYPEVERTPQGLVNVYGSQTSHEPTLFECYEASWNVLTSYRIW